MKNKFAAVLIAGIAAINPAIAQVPPEKAEATFTVHNPELEWKLWASEPLFANPTSMDIDHLGRVWVCESVNYRTKLRKKPLNRAEGDRILIIEDSKGTGKADKVTVFYQSPELLAPLGIAVAKDPVGPGWKVYVCQSPDILVFEDKDGDGHADGPPKKLLSGFRGVDHDHGVHGISIGPDGKLYFSVGDQGVENLQSSDGKGRKWTTNHTDCQAGTIWRCDLDGTNLELIAHNFRNEYEPCVDSFGNIWTSDNDDDGNQQTRICYVMPGGNYGYWPRGPGESHWHEEQPGVVPKVLRTYFGSPTGICVYEGTLLPKQYQGQLLHVDAGPRQVRCYHTKPKGAGFEIDREDMVTSTDNWFRPSDICVAPDGSVFVADWYDPGVGGHGMGDTTRGRIYRLAPKGSKYAVPKVDLERRLGLIVALSSPNLAVRYMAIARIRSAKGRLENPRRAGSHIRYKAGDPAVLEAVVDAAQGLPDISLYPRAVWQLGWLANRPDEKDDLYSLVSIEEAQTAEVQLLFDRVYSGTTGRHPLDWRVDPKKAIKQVHFTSVLREWLVLLRNEDPHFAKDLILNLAQRYDGQDRFYLAAIGIAVGNDPKRREIILADFDKQFPEWNDKVADLVWELRPPSIMPKLAEKLTDAKIPPAQRARIVDILATSDNKDAGLTMLKVVQSDVPAEVKTRAVENLRMFLPGKWAGLAKSAQLKSVIDQLLTDYKARQVGLQLVAATKYTAEFERVAKFASGGDTEAVRTLGQLSTVAAADELEKLSVMLQLGAGRNSFLTAVAAVKALGDMANGPPDSPATKRAIAILEGIVLLHGFNDGLKLIAVSGLAGCREGTQWLIQLKEKNQLPLGLVPEARRLLRNSPYQGLRNKALIAFPPPSKLDIAKLPSLSVLAARRGNAEAGKEIMKASVKGDAQCMKCHALQGQGGNVGPDLATIGEKASRENLFESIIFPSKAIADQYVQWNVTTKNGVTVSGLLIEEKPTHLLLRDANGKDIRIEQKDISDREKSRKSLMPDDIAQTLTEEELVNLVEYLVTLQKTGVK